MGISAEYCRSHPKLAANRIDELERQLEEKFFAPTDEHGPKHGTNDCQMRERTEEEVALALAFVDALDYSHGFTRWVDVMKTLAWAVRSNEQHEGREPAGRRSVPLDAAVGRQGD